MAKIVFMGTPAFAVPSLRAVAGAHVVVGVVTQPDRAAGRGRQVQASSVAQVAAELGVPVIQPASLRKEPEAVAQVRAWAPDVIVVAAFGQILRPEVLGLPPHGCINVHASLLPRWRGAAPIAHAVLAGDTQTGVTIMQMEAGLDTGPMLLSGALPIGPEDTTASLTPALAELGARLLTEALPGWLAGTLPAVPQGDAQVTLAPSLRKEQGRLDWQESAEALARRVRAFDPWPGTFTTWEGRVLKIVRAQALAGMAAPGEVVAHAAGFAIGTGAGLLAVQVVQMEGKRALDAAEFRRGYARLLGSRCV